MKQILLLLFILVGFSCLAQTPEGINYQAIARDNSGAEYVNTTLSVKFSISSDAIGATIIFTETHNTVATNDFGLFNLVLGNVSTADFTNIDWSNAPLYLIVEADFGSGFEQMGNPTPIVAVPYALYAKNVENIDDADADSTNEIQVLSISNDTIFLSNGGFVQLPASASSLWNTNAQGIDYSLGNVGIGVSNPVVELDVAGETQSNDVRVLNDFYYNNNPDSNYVLMDDGAGTGHAIWQHPDSLGISGGAFVSNGTETVLNNIGDNVGIGTNNPNGALQVNGVISAQNYGIAAKVKVKNAGGSEGAETSIGAATIIGSYNFDAWDPSFGAYRSSSKIIGTTTTAHGPGDTPSRMRFLTTPQGSTAAVERLTINDDGNVGIGTSTPNAKLEVSEDIIVNQITIGKGSGSITSNTANGYQALSINTTGQWNTANGHLALSSNTSGYSNTALGNEALSANSTGIWNTAVGDYALGGNDTGERNTAVGVYALQASNGNNNTALGHQALVANTSGDANIALGNYALNNNLLGINNTSVGFEAGYSAAGSNNLFLGYRAGYNETGSNKLYIESDSSSTPLIYGEFDNDILRVNGTLQVGDPTGSGYALPTIDGLNGDVLTTDASGNVTWQPPSGGGIDADGDLWPAGMDADDSDFNVKFPSQINDLNNDTKIQLEESANENIIRFDLAGTEKWAMHGSRLEPMNTGHSLFIGQGAGANDDLTNRYNVLIGDSAGYNNVIGAVNTAIGSRSLYENINGAYNTATGFRSLSHNTESNNTAHGAVSLYKNIDGFENTVQGVAAMFENTSGSQNTAMGYYSLYNNTSGTNNTAIGYQAGISSIGNFNIYLGYQAGYNETGSNKLYIESDSSSAPLIYGEFDNDILRVNGTVQINDPTQTGYVLPPLRGTAGQVLETDGLGNTSWQTPTAAPASWELSGNAGTSTGTDFIGTTDAQDLDIRTNDIIHHRFTQKGQLEFLNTGNSVFIGKNAGANDDLTNHENVYIGGFAGNGNTTGYSNVAVGFEALRDVSGQYANVAVGYRALALTTSGSQNVAVGTFAIEKGTGSHNSAFGHGVLNNNTSGSQNTIVGHQAMGSNEDGSSNSALGADALSQNITGESNVAVGYEAGNANISGNNNIFIGRGSNASAGNLTNASAIGFNVTVSASNSMVLGNGVNVGIGTSNPTEKLEVIGNVTANSYQYNSTQTRVFHINPATLSHHSSGATVDGNNWGGIKFTATLTNREELYCPLHLPDGAVVTAIDVTVIDNSPGYFVAWLVQYQPNTGQIMQTTTQSVNSAVEQVISSSGTSTIDNSAKSYMIAIRAEPGLTNDAHIQDIQVTYTVNEAR